MSDETIWHEWDPFLQVLKVAFVNKDGVRLDGARGIGGPHAVDLLDLRQ